MLAGGMQELFFGFVTVLPENGGWYSTLNLKAYFIKMNID